MDNSLIIILIFSFITSLFSLYILSHEDFVLIRKNISIEKIFNLAFLAFISSLFFSRIFFVVFNFHPKFLNPFTFILFPYFPGFSFAGGILGGIAVILLYAKNNKMPIFRIFDFFLLSFLSAMPAGFLISYLSFLQKKIYFPKPFYFLIFYLLLLGIFAKIFLPRMQKGELKEGSLGFMVLIFISFISLIYDLIGPKGFAFLLNIDFILFILIFLISLFFFLRQENFLPKLKKRST